MRTPLVLASSLSLIALGAVGARALPTTSVVAPGTNVSAASAPKAVDFFRRGVPQHHVAGLAVLELDGATGTELAGVGKGAARARAALEQLGLRHGVSLEVVRPLAGGFVLVDMRDVRAPGVIPDEDATARFVEQLGADAAVRSASVDKWMRPFRVPNDPGFDQMWHLSSIGAEAAWDAGQGLASQRVGVIDTGLIRSHEDVGGRTVNGFDFISGGNGSDGDGRDADFQDLGDGCPQIGQPNVFHGTHVAGTIGAGGNNGVGVTGLNWNAGLVIARALGTCGGDMADIMEAVRWMAGDNVSGVPAIGADKVSVMNLSLGSSSVCSSFEQQAVSFALSHGSVFVAATGNDGGMVGSPANCSGAVAVAAFGPNRDLTQYSSTQSFPVTIVAPGGDSNFGQAGDVLSTMGPQASTYGFLEGTSMAAPHVTGAISLLQAKNSTLSRDQIVSLLQDNAGACNCGGLKGLQLDAALAATPAAGGTPVDPVDPVDPPATDDALEQNDDFGAAVGGISCGHTFQLTALANDQDWFLFDTLAGESIDISMTSAHGGDLDLYVLTGPSSETDALAKSETTTGNEAVHVDAPGGRVVIVVNPYNDGAVANADDYTLAITCTGNVPQNGGDPTVGADPTDPTDPVDPPDPVDPGVDPSVGEDALEDNDTLDDAAPLRCNQTAGLTATDADFFLAAVGADGKLGLDVDANGLPLNIEVRTTDGEKIDAGTADDPPSLEHLTQGSYVVSLAPVGDVRGAYNLTLRCAASLPQQVQLEVTGGLFGCASTSGAVPPMAALLLALALLGRGPRRRGC